MQANGGNIYPYHCYQLLYYQLAPIWLIHPYMAFHIKMTKYGQTGK